MDTGGGAPYGITWEELGPEPFAAYEDLEEEIQYEPNSITNQVLLGFFIGKYHDLGCDQLLEHAIQFYSGGLDYV